jgi:hypothetical protein
MPGASNLAATTIEALDTRKIQVQVTAVARPRNHEDRANTAIRSDGGFLFVQRFFQPIGVQEKHVREGLARIMPSGRP